MLTAKQLSSKVKAYAPDVDTTMVEEAYRFAQKAHEGQFRNSGDPYFSHCVATARHLVSMQLDTITIAAGLLHDVPEDTEIGIEVIKEKFGEEVAFLVDGVTKLGKVRMSPEQANQDSGEQKDKAVVDREVAAVENLRKMFLAMAEDIRVVLIKLADRLHNMQTLDAIPEEKQRRIARETMEIYAPLAERLGMGEVKGELQDLSFKYIQPDEYAWISKAARPAYRNTEKYLRRVMKFVEHELSARDISADVHGRSKHLYSLYRKIQSKGRDFGEVYDLVAVRILVDDIPDCYEVLGLLHQNWKPLLGRIKDYIALPKPNGYQSLHTTVFCIDGRVVEFQIRTHQMHREAEFGIAAHWSYSAYKQRAATEGRRLGWVQQLAKWQAEISSNKDLLEELKIDTFKHRIFVFTPRGEVKDLPNGATPLDFAYSIHTKVGESCAGAKVNGKLTSLSTPLSNGDMVEILTSSRAKPTQGWLDMVMTSGARAHIRRYLREVKAREETVDSEKIGSLAKTEVAQPSSSHQPLRLKADEKGDGSVEVDGSTGYLVRLAKCCKPTVGDSIIGIVTIGKGVSIHQRWCANVQQVSDRGRLIRVAWSEDGRQRIDLRVEVYDKQGLTRDIANILARRGVHIVGIAGEVLDEGIGSFNLTVDMPNSVKLDTLTMDLLRNKNIYSVERQ